MKKNFLLFLFSSILTLYSCKTDSIEKVWLHTQVYSDGGGLGYGIVFDLSKQPIEIYSVIIDVKSDSLKLQNNIILENEDTLAELVWLSDKFLVTKFKTDTIILHKIPKQNLNKSYQDIYKLLINDRFSYIDDENIYEIEFDTSIFYQVILNSFILNQKYPNEYYTKGTWKLTKINDSFILFNLNPDEVLHESLLISEIYQDSIIALKLKIPYDEEINLRNAVENQVEFDFNYEKCVLKRIPKLGSQEKNKLVETLSSKTWNLKKVDTTMLSRGVPIGKWDSSRFYNKSNHNIEYKFSKDGLYSFILKDTTYSGNFTLSKDGKYILLDSVHSSNDFVELIEISEDKIKVRQHIEIKESDRRRSFYLYEMEFK